MTHNISTRTADDSHDLPSAQAPARYPMTLPVRRLNLMRVGYALMGIGLALVKWPAVVANDPARPLGQTGVDALLAALGILALLGLRHPTRMLPVLVFELAWKTIWLIAVALPAYRAGTLDSAMQQVVVNCSLAVVVLLVLPWRYAWRQYVVTRGDPWR
jgi:hypothetical protein